MMDPLPREDGRTRIVSDALRRRWLSILLITLVVGGGVGAYLFTRPNTYTSATTVLLRPLNANALSDSTVTSSQGTTVAMQTEASLVSSQPVTDRVNTALHTSLAADSGSVAVEVPANSQIIKIHYASSSANQARRIGQAYAESFLAYRTQLAETARDDQVRKLNTQRTLVEGDLQKALLALHGSNPPAGTQTQIDLDKSNLTSILDQIAQAQGVSTDAGSVILPATKGFPPSRLKPAAFTAAAVLAGAVLGFLFVLWRERRDDRLRSGVESSVVSPRVLATIPDLAADPAVRDEALRQARAMLLAVAAPNTVVAVAGVSVEDDATALAGELARSLAAAGYRPALLDASIKEASSAPGLSDLLTGELPDELPFTVVDGVSRLPSGTDPAGARERYSGAVLRTLLGRLRNEFDFVLVGIQPLSSGDGQAVALATDALILSATELRATHELLRTAEDAAARLGVTVLGLVLRKPSVQKHKTRAGDARAADAVGEVPRRRRSRSAESHRAGRRRGEHGESGGHGESGSEGPSIGRSGRKAAAKADAKAAEAAAKADAKAARATAKEARAAAKAHAKVAKADAKGAHAETTADGSAAKAMRGSKPEGQAESPPEEASALSGSADRGPEDSAPDESGRGEIADEGIDPDDIASDDVAHEDTAPVGGVRDDAADDIGTGDIGADDDASDDDSARDGSARDDSARDDSARDDSARDGSARDGSARDDSARGDAARDDSAGAGDDSAREVRLGASGDSSVDRHAQSSGSGGADARTSRTGRRNARRLGGRRREELTGDDVVESETVAAQRSSGGGADARD